MPVDRMAQLRAQVAENEAAEGECQGCSEITAKLQHLRRLNSELEETQAHHLAMGDRRSAKRIEKLIGDLARESQATRNLIVQFGNETQRLEARKSINASQVAMRKNVFENLIHKLDEVTRGGWDRQKQHEQNVTKQVEKRLRVRFTDHSGKLTLPEEDVSRIAKQLVDCGAEEEVFLLAKDELDKATRTRDAVRELEREMHDLYLVFCDLNTLVVEQGEGLQLASDNVTRANDNVQVGREKLVEARKLQRRCCNVM